jgi:hypothetical protein
MVDNRGDAWEFSRGELQRYFERVTLNGMKIQEPTPALTELLDIEMPGEEVALVIGAYLADTRLMGRRFFTLLGSLALHLWDEGDVTNKSTKSSTLTCGVRPA